MARRKLLFGNWKMNKTIAESKDFAKQSKKLLKFANEKGVDIGVAPVYLSLAAVKKANPKLTSFMMELNTMPIKETLEEMCIEIAKRTPDVKTNKDGRLNPYVGALLISKDKNAINVYGACRSAVHDGEHGECGLLTNLLGQYVAEGCEMFVSLEPCTQDSRHEWTEPCCEIIHNRRIKKVTIFWR